jgi:hypothetical protein
MSSSHNELVDPGREARIAAVLLWIVAAGWGFSAPWLIWWVLVRGRLPVLPIIGEANGGPFYFKVARSTFAKLLALSFLLGVAQAWAARLLWAGKRSGALLQFALLPAEAAFWYGFAIPIPPLLAIIRIVLTARAWRGLV